MGRITTEGWTCVSQWGVIARVYIKIYMYIGTYYIIAIRVVIAALFWRCFFFSSINEALGTY